MKCTKKCFKSIVYILILVLFILATVSYSILSVRHANELYNWFFIFTTIIFVLGTAIDFYFSLRSDKTEVYVSDFSLMLLFMLIPLSIVLAESITIITDENIIGIGHVYYNVRGIDIVRKTGYISSLKFIKTFDNFLSSPGLPIFGSILSMVTSFGSIQFVTFWGISFYALVLLFVYIVINSFLSHKIKNSSLSMYIFIAITVIWLISILSPFVNYNLVVLPLLYLTTYLLIRISLSLGNNVGNAISFLITLSASLLYYLPGVLAFAFIMGSLFFGYFLEGRRTHKENILKRTPELKWIVLLGVLLIILYIVYIGYFFYDDFSIFIYVMLRNIKSIPFVIVTGLREEILDSSLRFALYLSRINIMNLLIIIVAGFLSVLADRSVTRWLGLSTLLFASLVLISRFVHVVTDYVARFNIYLALVAPISLFIFFNKAYIINILVILKRLTGRFSLRKQQFIYIETFLLTLCLIGSVFSLLYSYLLIPLTPKIASDARYFMYDSWMVSQFVGKKLDTFSGIDIIGSYRYMYIQSFHDLKFHELSSYFVKNLGVLYSKGSWLLVLSSLSLKLPDRNYEPVSQEIVENLSCNTVLIYNSYYSLVFYNTR